MDKGLIDSSMIMEPFTNFKTGQKNYKLSALTILKYPKKLHFKPCICLSVLGELELIMKEKKSLTEQIKNKRERMQEILNNFFEDCEMVGLDKNTIHLAHTILGEDPRLDPVDVIHFASAISSGCKYFLFMDGKLENSNVIKRYAKENDLSLMPFNIPKHEDKGKPNKNLIWMA